MGEIRERQKDKIPSLLEALERYGESNYYPFHMPGHKRNLLKGDISSFPNPYGIDITEIDGFDNLHHPQGMLKESMEWAAGLYQADKTYYLINGSTCGVLSAICGTTRRGDGLLLGRNCHKSAYHGVILNDLVPEYIYPQEIPEFGLQGGLLPEEFEQLLETHPQIQAALVVSPTYDGIVSDIRTLAGMAHEKGIPLVVDEAHGAHFPFGKGFPRSALDMGADVVIQSLHKTLPSLTQTGVMHVKKGYVDADRIDRYVHMFQSSSPSYVLMAGLEGCLRWLDGQGRYEMEEFYRRLTRLRKDLEKMKHLRLFSEPMEGSYGIFDMDPSKILVGTRGCWLDEKRLDGAMLMDWLRKDYHLELEMCSADYVAAIATLSDREEGFARLRDALVEIDGKLDKREGDPQTNQGNGDGANLIWGGKPGVSMGMAQALDMPWKSLKLEDSAGHVAAEFIYLYPPGIPLAAPGEVMDKSMVEQVLRYKRLGLPVQGMADGRCGYLRVVDGTAAFAAGRAKRQG